MQTLGPNRIIFYHIWPQSPHFSMAIRWEYRHSVVTIVAHIEEKSFDNQIVVAVTQANLLSLFKACAPLNLGI